MADRKISDLTALTTPASGDYLPIVDISEGAAASKNKRVTIQSLFQGIPVNVGIGTSSPWSLSTVFGLGTVGDVTSSRQLSVGTSSTYNVSLGYYQTGAAQPFAGVVQALDNNVGTRLLLNPSGGNVGIGISSPTSLLHLADAGNIQVGTTTGTKIGTATTQKLGFYNATPVVQPAAVANATDAASVIARLNDLLARLRTLGIIAT